MSFLLIPAIGNLLFDPDLLPVANIYPQLFAKLSSEKQRPSEVPRDLSPQMHPWASSKTIFFMWLACKLQC